MYFLKSCFVFFDVFVPGDSPNEQLYSATKEFADFIIKSSLKSDFKKNISRNEFKTNDLKSDPSWIFH